MMDLFSLKNTYPNLSNRELERLNTYLNNFPNQSIEWIKIINKSDDPDPDRARAIDLARMRSCVRYHSNNGPKRHYGGSTKKVQQVDRKKLQAKERKSSQYRN